MIAGDAVILALRSDKPADVLITGDDQVPDLGLVKGEKGCEPVGHRTWPGAIDTELLREAREARAGAPPVAGYPLIHGEDFERESLCVDGNGHQVHGCIIRFPPLRNVVSGGYEPVLNLTSLVIQAGERVEMPVLLDAGSIAWIVRMIVVLKACVLVDVI